MKARLPRLRGRYETHFLWPCTEEEVLYPLPGLRRAPAPYKPVCHRQPCLAQLTWRRRVFLFRRRASCSLLLPAGGLSHASFRQTALSSIACDLGTGKPKPIQVSGWDPKLLRGGDLSCEIVDEGLRQLQLHELRWPPYYAAPRTPQLRAPSAEAQALQARWQGADLHAPLPDELAATLKLREPNHPPDYFALAIQELAARSFNGKELILSVSNVDGLPISLNLAANLAKLGYKHLLLLGANKEVCTYLDAADAPACGWSSLLRNRKRRMRDYSVGPLQLVWLQRWYYLLRMVECGYNVMMLDTDIILYRDIYPYFKHTFANHSLFSLHDSSGVGAKANGGVWYFQNAKPGGPVVRVLSEFRRRTILLLDEQAPLVTYDSSYARKQGKGADRFLDDQWVRCWL